MRSRHFPETDLYCLTASQFSCGRPTLDVVRQMLDAGVKLIQYREKEFPKLQKYRECLAIRKLCNQYQACFIVNDDLDIAMAVGADGVHLGQDDLPAEAARRLVGEKMLIGLSTHSPEQADAAVKSSIVDYIGVGPIFRTFTKKDVVDPVGLEYLDYVVEHHSIPLVAIGGIKLSNLAAVIKHGAPCVALVTEIVGAPDIGARIKAIRETISNARKA